MTIDVTLEFSRDGAVAHVRSFRLVHNCPNDISLGRPARMEEQTPPAHLLAHNLPDTKKSLSPHKSMNVDKSYYSQQKEG